MLKKLLSIFLLIFLLIIGVQEMSQAKENNWDKVFPKSDKVNIQKVEFVN